MTCPARELRLRKEWAGFDLIKIGCSTPCWHRFDELVFISGCLSAVNPMNNQAQHNLTIATLETILPELRSPQTFLAPMAMSRYESVNQLYTSATLRETGEVQICFNKDKNPMVLHINICCLLPQTCSFELDIARYTHKYIHKEREKTDEEGSEPEWVMVPDPDRSPSVWRKGDIAFLAGRLETATFGTESCLLTVLPKNCRPVREVRCLACLLRDRQDASNPEEAGISEDVVEHTIALTIQTDGRIKVIGGKMQHLDNKGNIRMLAGQKKKGRLALDGIRFATSLGMPLQPFHLIQRELDKRKQNRKGQQSTMAYLLEPKTTRAKTAMPPSTAAFVKQGSIVLLDGYLSWPDSYKHNSKQPIAMLPCGCWPAMRQIHFTRGSSDMTDRRRVDIDVYGRIFCPEDAEGSRVELSGIIFVAAEPSDKVPREPDWDDLKLQYQRNEVMIAATEFVGKELLEQFARQCTVHDWKTLSRELGSVAGRDLLLPLGDVKNRGSKIWDEMDLGEFGRIWTVYKDVLKDTYGINIFQTMLHVSDQMFDEIRKEIKMKPAEVKLLQKERAEVRRWWEFQRDCAIEYERLHDLAKELSQQMFEHWDFRAQVLGALQKDFRTPPSIAHLFPQRRPRDDMARKLRGEDMKKFEEIRAFFYLYETNGTNMTHCSLMGAQDTFTTTGKWHFPDAPDVQKKLFKNIGWLFERGIHHYISERQTQRFPFIEDLDCQCPTNYCGPVDEEGIRTGRVRPPPPPDQLLMECPRRGQDGKVFGHPGEFMCYRAKAIHIIFPHLDSLECYVYSASGYNKGRDMLKCSFHLVWPQLIVDSDRAPVIRQVTLGKFKEHSSNSGNILYATQKRLLELDRSNEWELLFDSTTVNAKNGLRLPYSDKASMKIANEEDKKAVDAGMLSKTKAKKVRVKENRVSKAVGVIRFKFDKDAYTGESELVDAKWIMDNESMPVSEWIRRGTCRRDPNNLPELTPWQVGPNALKFLPLRHGEKLVQDGFDDGEGGPWVTHRPLPSIRIFTGTCQEFVEKFQEHLQCEVDALQEDQEYELVQEVLGSFVHVDEDQVIWRGYSQGQFEDKTPDAIWGTETSRIRRRAEVIFMVKQQKVIVDTWEKTITETLIRM